MKHTPLVQKLFEIAKNHGWSYPLGRAYYATNRTYNGGLGRYASFYDRSDGSTDYRLGAQIKCMRDCRVDTAKRWIAHVRNGGSLKSMNRSVIEESKRRKDYGFEYQQRNQR